MPRLADTGDANPRTRIVGRRLDTIIAIAHTNYAQGDLTKGLPEIERKWVPTEWGATLERG